MPISFGIEPMKVLWSNKSFCKDLRDPISGAKNPWSDEFDNSSVTTRLLNAEHPTPDQVHGSLSLEFQSDSLNRGSS